MGNNPGLYRLCEWYLPVLPGVGVYRVDAFRRPVFVAENWISSLEETLPSYCTVLILNWQAFRLAPCPHEPGRDPQARSDVPNAVLVPSRCPPTCGCSCRSFPFS